MRRPPPVVLRVLLAALLARENLAIADVPNDAAVTARELFHHARALMEAEDYAGAATKLEESIRLDPSAAGTLLNLAVCHEKIGKTATASAEFDKSLVLARRQERPDRIAFAEEHLVALAPRIARLTIVVPPESRTEGLQISRDGVVLGPAVWGEALPIDPGPHVVTIAAPGRTAAMLSIEIVGDGARETVIAPVLDPAPATNTGVRATIEPPPQARPHTWTMVALTTGIAGGIAIATSAVLGGLALDANTRADGGCAFGKCSSDATDLGDRAKTYADIATITAVAGIALLAMSAVFYFTGAKAPAPPSPRGAVAW